MRVTFRANALGWTYSDGRRRPFLVDVRRGGSADLWSTRGYRNMTLELAWPNRREYGATYSITRGDAVISADGAPMLLGEYTQGNPLGVHDIVVWRTPAGDELLRSSVQRVPWSQTITAGAQRVAYAKAGCGRVVQVSRRIEASSAPIFALVLLCSLAGRR